MNKCKYCGENIDSKISSDLFDQQPCILKEFCCFTCYDLYWEGIEDE